MATQDYASNPEYSKKQDYKSEAPTRVDECPQPRINAQKTREPNWNKVGKTLDKKFDSACEKGGKVLNKLPMSLKMAVSAAVAYVAIDTGVYLDTQKHIHEHAQGIYEQAKQEIQNFPESIFK